MLKLYVLGFTCILFIFVHRSSAKLCDIKKWYKAIKDEGILPKYPSREQAKLKEYVDKKIANLQHSGSSKVDCDLLDDYKVTFSKRKLGRDSIYDDEEETTKHERGGQKDDREKASSEPSKRPRRNVDEDEYDHKNRRRKKEEEIDEDFNEKRRRRSSDEDETKYKRNKQTDRGVDEKTVDRPASKGEVKAEEPAANSTPDEDSGFDPTESEVDETELLNEEESVSEDANQDTVTEEAKINYRKIFEEELNKLDQKVKPKEVQEEAAGKELHKIDQKVKPKEVEDDARVGIANTMEGQSSHDISEHLASSCGLESQCSSLCYYSYQMGQSLDHYPEIQHKKWKVIEEEAEINGKPIPNQTKKDTDEEDGEKDMNTKEQAGKNGNSQRWEFESQQQGTVDEETDGKKELKDENETKANRKYGESSAKTTRIKRSIGASDDSDIHDHEKGKDEPEIKPSKTPVKKSSPDDDTNKHDSNKSKQSSEDSKKSYLVENEQISENQATHSYTGLNQEHFDLLFQQRASEYTSKIQQLEILLMKLENQLLGQQLHKQNDTNSYTKLEFQILKLENELLKLNQSYSKLSEDNEQLRKQQGELEDQQIKQQNTAKYAALPEANNTQQKEMITQQQIKITQLTDWLSNQTSILNKLRDKSDALAEQNQILYQIVMNQTALISNIMKKVHDLSADNLSYRKETQDLKSKMEIQDASSKIIERLDSLASDRKVKSNEERVDFAKKSEVPVNRKRFTFLPETPDVQINRHLWTCAGLQSSQICYMFSLILSPCPPFSTVYWRKCPKYISEKTAGYFMDYLEKFPDGELLRKPNIPVQPRIDDSLIGDGQSSNNTQETDKSKSEEDKELKSVEDKEQNSDEAANQKDKPEQSKLNEAGDTKDVGGKGTEKAVKEQQSEKKIEKTTNDEDALTKPPAKDDEDDDDDDEKNEGRPIKYKSNGLKKPKDCFELYQKGVKRNAVYKIFLPGLKYYVQAFCDMKNGGWTVLQKREGGRLNFFQDWKTYKEGFGSILDEYYLGNDYIHFLTNQAHYSLLVELTDWKNEKRTALYKDFWIDDEAEGYRLHVDGYDGDAGDGLSKHNEMKFSTHDVDNDKVVKQFGGSCANRFHGAGWYYKCYASNLNGRFYKNGTIPPKQFDGIAWKPWTGANYSLKTVQLKIRPKDVLDI